MHDRREFLTSTALGAAALGLATTLQPAVALASDAKADAKAAPAAKESPLALAAKTAAECVRAGDACIAHCTTELGQGNRTMANCNQRVHEMAALVRAMLTLASSEAALAKRLAPVCADACKACAEACAEHKEHWAHGMHLACKQCHEACLACEKACRAVV